MRSIRQMPTRGVRLLENRVLELNTESSSSPIAVIPIKTEGSWLITWSGAYMLESV